MRARLSTPRWTQRSNHTAKYYMMSSLELIFNFLTPLHEKFSNCLGGHFEVCADLIAGVNAVSAQMQTPRLSRNSCRIRSLVELSSRETRSPRMDCKHNAKGVSLSCPSLQPGEAGVFNVSLKNPVIFYFHFLMPQFITHRCCAQL